MSLVLTGCATADDSNFTASASTSPYGPASSAADDAGSSTGDELDDGAATETGASDPTGGPIDTGDGGGPPPAGNGDCCTAHAQGGCADAAIQACVCADDAECCEQGWDDFCVESVDVLGCAQCGNAPPPGDEGGPMGGGDCCAPQGVPGCADAMVESCVCNADPFCCQQEWNEECVFEVDDLGCGDCGGVMPPPDPSGGGDGACCMPTGGPGCGDPFVEECICGFAGDVYCCVEDWDAQCVAEVIMFGCGEC
ncbi:MAG TPA: hypothetical protein VFG69_17695 [Nannocystaceae bacterium]|nr:hypothetical protein [Nannocystaceae bacterium]